MDKWIELGNHKPIRVLDVLFGLLVGILLGTSLTIGEWKVQLRTAAEEQVAVDSYMLGRIEQGKKDLEALRGANARH